MIRAQEDTFRSIVEAAAQQLTTLEYRRDGAFISTPLLYPSGSTVVVQIQNRVPPFFVTDMGLGYNEADMMGAAGIFPRYARIIADNAGIRFDGQSMFTMEINAAQLAGAIATVANCSLEAAALAAYKLSERPSVEAAERLYERLVRVFSAPKVERHGMIVGASDTPHNVAAIVRVRSRPAVFEAVSKHPVSISFANSKFHDLALLEQPPINVAVVERKRELGTYLGLLAQAANVVEMDIPDQRIEKLVAA